MGLKIKSKTTR